MILKKAILDNLDSLRLMEKGKLVPKQDALTSLVLDNLSNSKNGLITKNELKKAIKEVASTNGVDLDNGDLS